MEQYRKNLLSHERDLKEINKQYNSLGFIRFLVVVVFCILGYCYYVQQANLYLFGLLSLVILFIFLIKKHDKIAFKRSLIIEKININKAEIAYLNQEKIPFENGAFFSNPSHPYTFDLDIFGQNSLFQHLNRTSTFIGGNNLAKKLSINLSPDEIVENQNAIKELANKMSWRHHILAIGNIKRDSPEKYAKLIEWSKMPHSTISKGVVFLSFLFPLALLVSLLLFKFLNLHFLLNIASYLFVFNIGLVLNHLKQIKKEIADSDQVHDVLMQYSYILKSIELESFENTKLNALKLNLSNNQLMASNQIQKLSVLVSNINSIGNVLGAAIMNGLFLFHLHNLSRIYNWKKISGKLIEDWMGIIGEFEALNSIANFSFNNSEFVFPNLNNSFNIEFETMGHPLIFKEKRICSDVSLVKQKFIILTGSNMSGKSTFLRSLGINMVLSGMGAPVCARQASVHVLPIFISMRMSDSLSEGESFFFAEVKRLKMIVDQLENEVSFVLLDEILKGTNSDDKRNGTIEVIKKLISKGAIGAIATHDLEVCATTNLFPDYLVNKCFEVEIENNELVFDYKLRDGICKNKSASFLMKKMGIIG
jgi:hypothetical protein